jgi:hypothetical protein
MQDVFIDAEGRIARIADHSSDLQPPAGTDVLDLAERTVIPGLIDTHVHLMATGLALTSIDLRSERTVSGIQQRLCAAAEGDWAGASWILGVGLELEGGGKESHLVAADLDAACRDRPVFVEHRSLHHAVVSSAGLRCLGVQRSQRGGHPKDLTDGHLSGSLLATARQRLSASLDPSLRRRAVEHATERAAMSGITTVHALDGGDLFGDADVELLLDLHARCATWIVLYWITTDVEKAQKRGLWRVGGDILLDGTIGSRTAALRAPYADDPASRGTLYRHQSEVDAFFLAARAAGLQPAVHAIGGRAIEQALRAIEHAAPEATATDFRPRIEHFAEPTRQQVRRAAQRSAAVATQPPFPYLRAAPAGVYERRLGPARVRRVYPLRWLADEGVRFAGGSDSPVGPCDGILGLHASCNAPHAAQRLSAREALRAYTVDAAWAGLEEHQKGDLRTGLLADLVVLDRDPLSIRTDEIRETRVLLTMKGGKTVYDARPRPRV